MNETTTGNMVKMREALIEISNLADALDVNNPNVVAILDECSAALAEQLRNCDVGTAEEQARRFDIYCSKKPMCEECKRCLESGNNNSEMVIESCAFTWSQLPYESEVKK